MNQAAFWQMIGHVFERIYVYLTSLPFASASGLTIASIIVAGIFVVMIFKLFFDKLG